MLRVMPSGETKNMLDFIEFLTGEKITIMKTDFIKAVEQLKFWRQNQSATNFSSMLFSLFCKADSLNRIKFLHGFPAEMIVYLLWYYSKSEDEFFEMWSNIKTEEPKREDTDNGNEN